MRLPLKMSNDTNNAPTIKADDPVQVTTNKPKKAAAGKRLAEFNHRRKKEPAQKEEELAQKEKELAQKSKDQENEPKPSQAYCVGAVIAVGVSGFLHLPKM